MSAVKSTPGAKGASPARAKLLERLEREMRQASGLGVMFSQAVASRLGITPAELESLDYLATNERVSAGDLARITGLSTGAVTGMIDRLERAGFARRERDLADRRRIYVRLEPRATQAAARYYDSLQASMAAVLNRYSDAEIALLLDFFARSRAVMANEIDRIAGARRKAAQAKAVTAPRHAGAAAPHRQGPRHRGS